MIKPDYYDVNYNGNVHMDVGYEVDPETAQNEWEAQKDIYEEDLGLDVHVVEPEEGLPDMVFAANHGFTYRDNEELKVVPARMANKQRKGEVEPVMDALEGLGAEILEKPDAVFEGAGDAMAHPEEGKVFVGYGKRTEKDALEEISDISGKEVVGLELTDDKFYHLDTCFEHLDSDTALFYPDAVADGDIDKVYDNYENVIEVPEDEADDLAANAHCPNGEDVIIREETSKTAEILEENGFNVYSTATSEFVKSGGSVDCMNLDLT